MKMYNTLTKLQLVFVGTRQEIMEKLVSPTGNRKFIFMLSPLVPT
jgi:hypothetical protein